MLQWLQARSGQSLSGDCHSNEVCSSLWSRSAIWLCSRVTSCSLYVSCSKIWAGKYYTTCVLISALFFIASSLVLLLAWLSNGRHMVKYKWRWHPECTDPFKQKLNNSLKKIINVYKEIYIYYFFFACRHIKLSQICLLSLTVTMVWYALLIWTGSHSKPGHRDRAINEGLSPPHSPDTQRNRRAPVCVCHTRPYQPFTRHREQIENGLRKEKVTNILSCGETKL